MPIGQIPHALVVPYDELTLDNLIGAGAEGKVSVAGRGGGPAHVSLPSPRAIALPPPQTQRNLQLTFTSAPAPFHVNQSLLIIEHKQPPLPTHRNV
jgi:hypothetical protein